MLFCIQVTVLIPTSHLLRAMKDGLTMFNLVRSRQLWRCVCALD